MRIATAQQVDGPSGRLQKPASPADAQPRFSSLLNGEASTGPDLLDDQASQLRGSMAQVFDAFGFFPENPGRPLGEDGREIRPADPSSAARRADRTGRGLALPDESAAAAEAAAKARRADDSGQAARTMLADDRGLGAQTGPASAGRPQATEETADHHPAATCGQSPSAVGTTDPAEGAWVRARAAQDEVVPAEGARGAAHETAATSSDRLCLTMAGGTVELAGRFASLSDDDERRLVEALGEILEAHGIAPGDIIINGRRIAGPDL